MELTSKNYFNPEMNLKYLDCSTYKNFVGTVGRKGCECRALAIAKGMYEQPKTEALLLGGYVDAYFDNTLAEYMIENMEDLYTKASIKKFNDGKGDLELLAAYKQADVMIKRAIKEPLFMKYMEGETQKILTADIDGVPIRVKLDVYNNDRIVDLKTAASMTQTYYAADSNSRMSFVENFGYVEQAFFYQTAVEQNFGKKLHSRQTSMCATAPTSMTSSSSTRTASTKSSRWPRKYMWARMCSTSTCSSAMTHAPSTMFCISMAREVPCS